MNRPQDSLEQAIALACRAHRGQTYPSPEPEPYVLHLFRVMLALSGLDARVTAVLHDLLEDTDTTVNELAAARFSQAVIDAVVALTRCPEQTYEEYIEVVAQNRLARVVKLADLADNLANNRQLPSTPEVQERILRYERAIERLRASGGELPDVSDR